MIKLEIVKRTHPELLREMAVHYSQPKGFVGRNICYRISYDGIYYGSIVGGSATKHLPGRHDFLGTTPEQLNMIVNNIFFHIEPGENGYPINRFASKCLKQFRIRISEDWELKYKNKVIGFESLVELPRTGQCYKSDGWILTGQTKGYTCKRTSGQGTDSWGGKRVWDVVNLRPKLVFCKKNT